jgi:hypothetical protein
LKIYYELVARSKGEEKNGDLRLPRRVNLNNIAIIFFSSNLHGDQALWDLVPY